MTLADALFNAGISHMRWDAPGYGTPNNPTRSGITTLAFTPEFTLVHHTGGTFTSPEFCIRGRTNVPGPLYHILVERDATVNLLTEGRANHAGVGDPLVLGDVRADVEPATTGIPSDLSGPTMGGNRWSYGIAMQGRGSTHTPQQVAVTKRVVAAIHVAQSWSHRICRGHKEWTERKIDPELGMYVWLGELEGLIGMGRFEQELTDDQITYLIDKVKAETDPNGFNLTPTSEGHAVMLLRALAGVAGVSATDEAAIAQWIAKLGDSDDPTQALTKAGLIALMDNPAVQATMRGVIGDSILDG